MVYCSQHKVNFVRAEWRGWRCPEDRTERVSDADLMRTLGGIEGVSFVTYTRLRDGSVRLRGMV